MTINGLKELTTRLVAIITEEFKVINSDLIGPLQRHTPLGPSGRLKKTGWRVNKPLISGAEITSGATNTLPYAARQDVEELRHIPQGRVGTDYHESFGTLFGKTKTKTRLTQAQQYWRGYRKAIDDGSYDTYAIGYIDQACQDVGIRIEEKIRNGPGDWTYIVNADTKLQRVIDDKLK